MLEIRRSEERGHFDHGWLNSYHSFSFAEYYDAAHVQFGALRVINEDRVQPGEGFPRHGHRDMEIVSYVLSGALRHQDSMGTSSVIRPGEVQRMSAGKGVLHSEYSASDSEETHFLQIWLMPRVDGKQPSYEQKRFSDAEKRGRLALIGSADGRDGSVMIDQDVSLYAGLFDGAERAIHRLARERRVYVHVVRGTVTVNGVALKAGDAIKALDPREVTIENGNQSEVLLFDLA